MNMALHTYNNVLNVEKWRFNQDMALIKTEAFKCNKCGHVWISTIYTHKNPPVACAKCKTPYWNR